MADSHKSPIPGYVDTYVDGLRLRSVTHTHPGAAVDMYALVGIINSLLQKRDNPNRLLLLKGRGEDSWVAAGLEADLVAAVAAEDLTPERNYPLHMRELIRKRAGHFEERDRFLATVYT